MPLKYLFLLVISYARTVEVYDLVISDIMICMFVNYVCIYSILGSRMNLCTNHVSILTSSTVISKRFVPFLFTNDVPLTANACKMESLGSPGSMNNKSFISCSRALFIYHNIQYSRMKQSVKLTNLSK